MGRRNQKSSCHRKSSSLQAQRSMPVNVNACHEKQSEDSFSDGVIIGCFYPLSLSSLLAVILLSLHHEYMLVHPTARLESFGTLMIEELRGSKRDRLKQQFLASYVSQTSTAMQHLPSPSSKSTLEQLLADLHRFDHQTRRQYQTMGTGDHDAHMNPATADVPEANDISPQSKNTEVRLNEPPSTNRRTRQKKTPSAAQSAPLEPKTITRTICTRSSKLAALMNNNQNQSEHIVVNRARKRRSSSIGNHIREDPAHNADGTHERPLTNTVSGVKVSRKKLQPSIPSPERPQINDHF